MVRPSLVLTTSVRDTQRRNEKHNRILKEDVDRFIEHVVEQIRGPPKDWTDRILCAIFEDIEKKQQDRLTVRWPVCTSQISSLM